MLVVAIRAYKTRRYGDPVDNSIGTKRQYEGRPTIRRDMPKAARCAANHNLTRIGGTGPLRSPTQCCQAFAWPRVDRYGAVQIANGRYVIRQLSPRLSSLQCIRHGSVPTSLADAKRFVLSFLRRATCCQVLLHVNDGQDTEVVAGWEMNRLRLRPVQPTLSTREYRRGTRTEGDECHSEEASRAR
jgi:hypothetical protein